MKPSTAKQQGGQRSDQEYTAKPSPQEFLSFASGYWRGVRRFGQGSAEDERLARLGKGHFHF